MSRTSFISTNLEDEDAAQLAFERSMEYSRLSKINKRVMQYFFRLRSLDDYLESIRRNMEKANQQHGSDLDNMEDRYKRHVKSLTEAKEKAENELEELQADLASAKIAASDLESKHDDLVNELHDLKSRNKSLAHQSKESSVRLAEAELVSQSTSHKLEMRQVENDSLKRQLADAKKRQEEFNDETDAATKQADNCKKDLEKLKRESKVTIDEMRERVQALQRKSTALEDILRKEFGLKLQHELSECQKVAQAKKNRSLSEMKKNYDEKWSDYNDRISKATEENDSLRQQVVDVTLELKTLQQKHRGDDNLAKSEERRAEQIKTELENVEFSIAKANLEDLKKIQELEDLLAVKDTEYADLLQIKNDLAMEIQAYRLLLENEEDRMKGSAGDEDEPSYLSPSRKRKSPSVSSSIDDSLPPTIKARKSSTRIRSSSTRRSTRNR